MDGQDKNLRIAIEGVKRAIEQADKIGSDWQPFYLHDGSYNFDVCALDVDDLRVLLAAVEGGK